MRFWAKADRRRTFDNETSCDGTNYDETNDNRTDYDGTNYDRASNDGTNGYLMNIYSLPQYRGRGIGKQIVEYLIRDAKARGTGKIYLESAPAAKKLYFDLGFTDMKDYMKL